jgi:hypothetical protein
VSPEPRAPTSPSAIAPVPERAAAAILGSMIALILILMAILVQTTWMEPASATDAPGVETPGYAQR